MTQIDARLYSLGKGAGASGGKRREAGADFCDVDDGVVAAATKSLLCRDVNVTQSVWCVKTGDPLLSRAENMIMMDNGLRCTCVLHTSLAIALACRLNSEL